MQTLFVELVKKTVIPFFNMTIDMLICVLKVITLILTLIVYCLNNVILIHMEILEQLNASVLVLEAPLQTQILDFVLLYVYASRMVWRRNYVCIRLYISSFFFKYYQVCESYCLSIYITKQGV